MSLKKAEKDVFDNYTAQQNALRGEKSKVIESKLKVAEVAKVDAKTKMSKARTAAQARLADREAKRVSTLTA